MELVISALKDDTNFCRGLDEIHPHAIFANGRRGLDEIHPHPIQDTLPESRIPLSPDSLILQYKIFYLNGSTKRPRQCSVPGIRV